jgi:DNA-binding transcriptional ArsR family regulator
MTSRHEFTVGGGPATDRPPPHSLDAERAVLGALIVGADREGLSAEANDFYRWANQRIFLAIEALNEQDRPVDLVTLRDELGADIDRVGGPAYIASLTDGVPKSVNVVHYGQIVRHKAIARRVTATCEHAAALIREDPSRLPEARRALAEMVRSCGWQGSEGGPLPLRTPEEIAQMVEARAEFLAPYIVSGALTEIDAYAKRGKTSFVLYLVGCIVHGLPALEQPTQQVGVVYLTEERPPTFRRALARAGLLAAPGLNILSRWDLPASLSWPAIVLRAEAACRRLDAGLLVIDTLPQWAGLRGDTENNAGDALAAVEPLQRAAAGGLAVLVTRHDRKGGGAVGESGRGSSAFAAAVDTIVSLRRPEGRSDPSHRLLEAVSRFDEIPEAVVVARRSFHDVPLGSEFEETQYRSLGEPGALESEKAEAAVLAVLEGSPATVKTLKEALPDVKAPTLTRGLASLRERGLVDRSGRGVSGDPYVYARAEVVSFQTPIPGVRDEKIPAAAGAEVLDL